jgi:hypothetical protein
MNIDDENEYSDGELDRHVRAALAMDVDAAGLRRLEEYWRAQAWKDHWRRRVYFAMSAAAAAAILVVLLTVAKRGREDVKTEIVNVAPVQPRVDVQPIEQRAVEREEPSSQLAGRTPTEYERFLFIVRTGKPTPTTAESKIDQAIRRGGANSQDVLAEVEQIDGVQGLLLTARRAGDPTLRQAAMARLLEMASDESLLGFLSL